MMRPVVLFVDDEPNLLSGLKRITHSFRKDWDTHFADCGETALDMIASLPINTLITDMRMPGMDGARLLGKVSATYPGIFRMALSGESDLEQALTIAGRSHQFLAKPTEPTDLYKAVQKVFNAGGELFDEIYDRKKSLLDRLKSAHTRLEELEVACSQKENALLAATATVMSDPSLSARLLQLVNSAYFGSSMTTVNIAGAVQHVGIGRLRELVKRDRLGTEHSEESATGRDNLLRAQAALFAHDIAARGDLTKSGQNLAYSIALFSALGVDANDDQRRILQLPASIAALLGLPDILVWGLGEISQLGADLKEPEDLGRLACDIARKASIEKEEAA